MRVTYGTAGGTARRPRSAEPAAHRCRCAGLMAIGPGASAVLGTTDHTDLFPLLQGDALRHGH